MGDNRQVDFGPVFDGVVLKSLGPLCLGLIILFTLFAVTDSLAGYPPDKALLIVTTDVVSALLYLGLFVLVRSERVSRRWINEIGFLVGSVALFNAILTYVLLDDLFYLTYVPIIMIGYGAFLLSIRWLVICLVTVCLVTLGAAWPMLSAHTVIRYGPILFGAALLAIVLVVVRRWGVVAAHNALLTARSQVRRREQIEAELAQSRHLESVGKLASGVAHDFNNLLTVVIGAADSAMTRTDVASPVYEELKEIRKAGESGASLTAQLLAFARQQALSPRVMDINEVIDSSKSLLSRSVREDIRLLYRLDPSAGHARIDPVQFQQVLMNLVANARDAMPDGGSVTIGTRRVSEPPESTAPGDCVEIVVADSGAGMEAEVKNRVFEPFFSTKGPERGTGLGLATAHGIINQSGGSISVSSEPARGTTFRILLPRANETVASRYANSSETPVRPENVTVLLVEDEAQVREVLESVLRRHGYRTIVAENAVHAHDIARTESFDVLLTDVVMPGITGIQLAMELRSDGHEVGVLFMSGYTADAAKREASALPRSKFLSKPFRGDELAVAIQEVLVSDPHKSPGETSMSGARAT